MRNWKNFTGKDVVIMASGARYSGRLIEMTDLSVILKMSTGHAEIPMESINSIELATGRSSSLLCPSPLAGLPRRKEC